MITRGFIEKVRATFDELSIEAKDGISYDDFVASFFKTLNRCSELSDAKYAITLFDYCDKNWNKIEKIFNKHLDRWKSLQYEGASQLRTVTDEEANGVYYITNAIYKNQILFSSTSFDDEFYSFENIKGKYYIKIDGKYEYYLKNAKTDAGIMKMFDKNDNLLCNIVLSKTFDVFLEKNQTPYELVIKEENEDDEERGGDTFIGVFEKSYIDSLGENDYIDFKNMVASISWDLISKNSNLGVAQMELYREVDDITPLLYFATSTFLLFKSYNNERNNLLALSFHNPFKR